LTPGDCHELSVSCQRGLSLVSDIRVDFLDARHRRPRRGGQGQKVEGEFDLPLRLEVDERVSEGRPILGAFQIAEQVEGRRSAFFRRLAKVRAQHSFVRRFPEFRPERSFVWRLPEFRPERSFVWRLPEFRPERSFVWLGTLRSQGALIGRFAAVHFAPNHG